MDLDQFVNEKSSIIGYIYDLYEYIENLISTGRKNYNEFNDDERKQIKKYVKLFDEECYNIIKKMNIDDIDNIQKLFYTLIDKKLIDTNNSFTLNINVINIYNDILEVFQDHSIVGLTIHNKGIRNLGGYSCYMSSVLQALYNTPNMLNLFNTEKDNNLITELVNAYTTPDDIINPKKIKKIISKTNTNFNNTNQQDALEFFGSVFSFLPDSIKILFKINTFNNKQEIINDDQYWLSINASNIIDGIKNYYDNEEQKRLGLNINKLSKYVVVWIKRYDNNRNKLNYQFDIGESFFFEKTYNLYAFIVHYGSTINSGHYVCYFKNDDNWIYSSDATVYPVSVEEVFKKFNKENVYGLFYYTSI